MKLYNASAHYKDKDMFKVSNRSVIIAVLENEREENDYRKLYFKSIDSETFFNSYGYSGFNDDDVCYYFNKQEFDKSNGGVLKGLGVYFDNITLKDKTFEKNDNIRIGNFNMDIEYLKNGKYDLYMSHDNSLGQHYSGITIDKIGDILTRNIEKETKRCIENNKESMEVER